VSEPLLARMWSSFVADLALTAILGTLVFAAAGVCLWFAYDAGRRRERREVTRRRVMRYRVRHEAGETVRFAHQRARPVQVPHQRAERGRVDA